MRMPSFWKRLPHPVMPTREATLLSRTAQKFSLRVHDTRSDRCFRVGFRKRLGPAVIGVTLVVHRVTVAAALATGGSEAK